MQTKYFSVRQSAAMITGALALIATNAHATYMVIDDDLYPTKVLMARDRGFDEEAAEKYKVTFNRGSSLVGPNAKLYLDDLVPRIQAADRIRVVGRADSASASDSRKQRGIAMARASAIRAYLIRAGLSASSIETDVDTGPNPLASSGISPVEISTWNSRVSRPSFSEQARTQPERAIPRSYRYLNQDTEPQARPAAMASASGDARALGVVAAATQPTATSRPQVDDRLIQYINQAVQTGQMSPAVAAQILSSLAQVNANPQPTQVQATAAQVPVPPTPTAIQAPVRVERWVLDARLTLKDNLDEWSKASGWQPSLWEASNFYQVQKTTSLDGAFPDVLKRIADSTGLNICAFPREKQVRVTDANVPCRK